MIFTGAAMVTRVYGDHGSEKGVVEGRGVEQ